MTPRIHTGDPALDALLLKLHRAEVIGEAADTVRRGFDLTDDVREDLMELGIVPEDLQQEFGDEHLPA